MSTVEVTISAGEGGTVKPCGRITVPICTDVDIVAKPNPGYKVLDWYCNGGMGHTELEFRVPGISRDTTVHVEFEPIVWSIRTTPQKDAEATEGRIEPESGTGKALQVRHGQSLAFEARPAEGHFLQRWMIDEALAQTGGDRLKVGPVEAEHHVRAIFSPMPAVRPFAAMPSVLPLTLQPDEALARELRTAIKGQPGAQLAIADATDLLRCPDDQVPVLDFACSSRGSDDRAVACDSLAKVGVMVALYRLRAQLRALAVEVDAREKHQLLRVAGHYWKSEVSRAFPRYGADFPDIDGLFDGPPQRIDFSRSARQHLDTAIKVSGNSAARDLMKALGFQYLHGALRAEGLCDGPGKGIWIPKRFGDLAIWRGAPVSTGGHCASPRALTGLFAGIARGRLVDAQASREMRELLAEANTMNSHCGLRDAQDAWSKIGFLTPSGGDVRCSESGWFRVPIRSLGGAPSERGSVTFIVTALGFVHRDLLTSVEALKQAVHAAARAIVRSRSGR
jgi:hypothetical protein